MLHFLNKSQTLLLLSCVLLVGMVCIFQTGMAEDIGIKGNNMEQFQLDKSKVMQHKFLLKTITDRIQKKQSLSKNYFISFS